MSFSPDGRRILAYAYAYSSKADIRVFDADTGLQVCEVNHFWHGWAAMPNQFEVQWNGDSATLTVAGIYGRTLHFFSVDARSGVSIQTAAVNPHFASESFEHMQLLPCCQYAAVACTGPDAWAHFVCRAAGAVLKLLPMSQFGIYVPRWPHLITGWLQSRVVLSFIDTGTVMIDLLSDVLVNLLPYPTRQLAVSLDARLLCCREEDALHIPQRAFASLVDLVNGELRSDDIRIFRYAFSPDSSKLIGEQNPSGRYEQRPDLFVIYDTLTLSRLWEVKADRVGWFPDGRWVAIGKSSRLRFIDVMAKRPGSSKRSHDCVARACLALHIQLDTDASYNARFNIQWGPTGDTFASITDLESNQKAVLHIMKFSN